MKKIICYTSKLAAGSSRDVSFEELLLDETWAAGQLEFPESLYLEIGNINTKLAVKQNYEFLLRAAKKYPILAVGVSSENNTSSHSIVTCLQNNSSSYKKNIWNNFCTDCYIIGKYQQELLDCDSFNTAIETLLSSVSNLFGLEAAAAQLQKMISHSPEYYAIDDNTRPILIYRGDSTCYNQLNVFADELVKAFIDCGQQIEVFDIQKEGADALTKYIGRHFKAIIGIQTYLFSIMMQDKTTNLHDLVIAPKFNLILDHPAWLKEHITHGPENYYLLSHDRNYIRFAKKYYKNIRDCFYFAPAGIPPKNSSKDDSLDLPAAASKLYDISFIGTYYDYRHILGLIKSQDRQLRFLTAHLLQEMKSHPDLPAETALENILRNQNISLSDEEFLNLFYKTRYACFCVTYYYREKIIRTLLNADITIHVYGDSWMISPFADHPRLVIHPALTPAENLLVMQQTKVSLNIMTWHKDGLTERILNAMLCRSAVISDKSVSLEEYFTDRENIVLFSLEHLEELPSKVRNLFADENLLRKIAYNGYQKCRQEHLWLHRAAYFLQILENRISDSPMKEDL